MQRYFDNGMGFWISVTMNGGGQLCGDEAGERCRGPWLLAPVERVACLRFIVAA